MADADQQVTAWDEHGNPVKSPATGPTAWDEHGNPISTPTAITSGSFQQRKGGPILNANKTGIQGQSKKEVTENLKSDAAAGPHLGPGTTPGRLVDEATLGAASGFSGMPESSHPLQDVGASLKSQQDELMAHPVKTIAKSALLGPAPQLYDIGKGLVESGGEIGSGIAHLDPEKVAHGGGGLIGKLAAVGALEEVPKTAGQPSTVGITLSKIARDPISGELKPVAVTTGKVGGGLIGGIAGAAGGEALLGGHSTAGGIYGGVQGARAGTALGPTVVEKMVPPRPVYPGASLPDAGEFYEHKAADLAKRGREQEILDRKSAREAKTAIPKIIEPNQPIQTGPNIESEGRPATWTNEKVLELAAKGNRAAIAQAGARQLTLPPNARYVMGDLDYRNQITSPREVTKFSPTGEPIRQEVARPLGKNIDTIASAGRQRPLLLGKQPATPATPNIPQLNFEQPIQVPSEGPVKPMTAPTVGNVPRETIQPMQKPAETGPEPRRALPGETPERRKVARDVVNDMSVEQLERDANKTGVSPEDKARMLRNAADLREMRAEEPKEVKIKGLTAVEPKQSKVKPMEKPVSIEKTHSREEIADAEGLIQQEVGMMQSADRPGRYFDESSEGEHILTGRGRPGIDRMGGSWRGVQSLRPHLPFMKENPQFTPAQLEKALRNKDSAMYRKVMDRAFDFLRREKEAGTGSELGEHVPGEEEFPPKQ